MEPSPGCWIEPNVTRTGGVPDAVPSDWLRIAQRSREHWCFALAVAKVDMTALYNGAV